jgi:hypothetical protein
VRKPKKGSTKKPLPAKQPLQRGEYQALTRLLRTRAKEMKLSIRKLEKALNKPRSTVHKTLSGQRRLDPIEFISWCEALELKDPVAVIKSVRKM